MVVAFVALRLLDLALFLQQEHRGSTRLKVPLGLHGALQLAPCFLSFHLWRFIRRPVVTLAVLSLAAVIRFARYRRVRTADEAANKRYLELSPIICKMQLDQTLGTR